MLKKETWYKIAITALIVGFFFSINYVSGQNRAAPVNYSQSPASTPLIKTSNGWVEIFQDYTSWPSGTEAKSNDYLLLALNLISYENPYYNFVDLNGDGLIDIIHHRYNTYDDFQYAVFINNGRNDFDVAYKCIKKPNLWYGDCVGSGSVNPEFFSDYQSWPSSSKARSDDYLRLILQLTRYGNPYYYNLIDINGDGLVDLLYYIGNNDSGRYAIFINNGQNSFEPLYKCVYNNLWYGDCVGDESQTSYLKYFFDNYKEWPSSTEINSNDMIIRSMFQITGNDGIIQHHFRDFNGDGLTDLLYYSGGESGSWISSPIHYAIFLNNGVNSFTPFYKCTHAVNWEIEPYNMEYYGDCAQK